MSSTYEQLATIRTQSAIATDIYNRAAARGANVKGLTDADLRRILIEVIADVRESEETARLDILNSGFVDLAEGAMLDLLGVGFFDEERLPATAATVQLRMYDTVGQGPYDVPARTIAVVGADTESPLYYRLATAITVPQSGEKLECFFEAIAVGAAYNILSGTPVKLATPIPGVGIIATFVTALSGVVVKAGTDAESDASYRQRLRDKWATLSAGWTAAAIRYHIRKILPNATRIFVRDDAPASGQAWAYCAGPTAPISTADAVAAMAYLNDSERKPVSNRPVLVIPSIPVVVPLAITLYTDGSDDALSLAAARLAASTVDYIERIYPISRANDALYDVDNGVLNVAISPSDDVQLAPEEVISLQPTYTVELF
jgi:uncharacterized phage protein gp47/JayE